MKYIKNVRCIALFTIVALGSIGCDAQTKTDSAKKGEELFANPVLAKGKNFEVKQSEVESAFIDHKANMASRGQAIPESQRPMIESNLLDRIVITKVLVNRASDADKETAKKSTEKLIADAKKQFPSEEIFNQQLKATGMSPEQFHARAFEQTLCEVVVERELKSKITITDEAARKFYDENPAEFEQPETVRAAHILLSTVNNETQQPISADAKKEKEQLAKKLKERADKGEDFALLVKEYSEDPGSKDKGGEYKFSKGRMVPEFETAAFSLKTNQISDPVETRFGFHVIKLLEKTPAEKVAFEKALPDLKEGLVQQEAQKQVPDYFEKIKKEANVEIVGNAKTPTVAPTEKPAAK